MLNYHIQFLSYRTAFQINATTCKSFLNLRFLHKIKYEDYCDRNLGILLTPNVTAIYYFEVVNCK